MNNSIFKKFLNDYSSFERTEAMQADNIVSSNILKSIQKKLKPSATFVFFKLTLISFITSLISLALCPQFGIGTNLTITHFLMKYGEHICSIFCGILFSSIALSLAALIINKEELAVLKRIYFLQVTALSLIALFAFYCAGAEVWEMISIFWLIGAIIGGIASLKIVFYVCLPQKLPC